MRLLVIILIAFILDLWIGDPYTWPHPVKWMGHYIDWFLKKTDYLSKTPQGQRTIGIYLWVSLVTLSGGLSWLAIWGLGLISPWLGMLVSIYLTYTCFSVHGLAFEAKKVYRALKEEGLEAGRKQVGMIVGRQTDQLSQEEIINATIETVAENASDGFVAPLLYICLLGPVGGMLYKAINTLDSMVAYKTEKYLHVGYLSAKVDDLANLIPARLTWCFLILAAYFLNLNAHQAFKIGRRDARNHLSPNSGFPESVVAGALGIQLGGSHYYHHQLIEKPTIGDRTRDPELEDILTTNRLLYVMAALAVLILGVIRLSITFGGGHL